MRGVGLERVDLLAYVAAVAEALRGGEAALQRRAVASRETTCGDSGAREEGGERRENAHTIGGRMWLHFSTSSSGHVMRYVRKTKNKNKIGAIKFRGERENRIDSV